MNPGKPREARQRYIGENAKRSTPALIALQPARLSSGGNPCHGSRAFER
jgi:hypothetical protein